MRLIHVVVSRVGFRDLASNPVRWALLDQLLELARRESARLLVLPGGYLAAADRAEMLGFIDDIGQRAGRVGVAVLGGIDLSWPDTELAATEDDAVRNCLLPFYGFAAGPLTIRQPDRHPWRQTSTTSGNAWFIADENVPGAERVVVVDELEGAVLICGELFSERTRGSIADLGVALTADLGHQGMGSGLVPAMTRLAIDAECAVAHAQHLLSETGSIHLVDSGGLQHSHPATANGLFWQGDLWAGWAARDV
jgi:hypothetical protein